MLYDLIEVHATYPSTKRIIEDRTKRYGKSKAHSLSAPRNSNRNQYDHLIMSKK